MLIEDVNVVDHIEVTRVPTERLEELYARRYEAFLAAGSIAPNSSERLIEDADSYRNTINYCALLDGEMVGGMRVTLLSAEHASSPANDSFAEIFAPGLVAGHAYIDSSALWVAPSHKGMANSIALDVMRPAVWTAEVVEQSWLIATARKGHMPFYIRNFGGEVMAQPRAYLGRKRRLGLVGNEFQTIRSAIYARYPHFLPEQGELDRLKSWLGILGDAS